MALKFKHADTGSEFAFDLEKITEPLAGQIAVGVLVPDNATAKKAAKGVVEKFGFELPEPEAEEPELAEEPEAEEPEPEAADAE